MSEPHALGTEHVQVRVETGVVTVTLNRPKKLNALTVQMISELREILHAIDAEPQWRCVVFTSVSGRAFCAGADIGAWSTKEPLQMWREWIRTGNQVFDLLATLRQPTIAAIEGIAYGGGLELALACDIRIAGTQARFALPEVTLGTVPGWRGGDRLQQLIGASRSKQMVFSGEPIDAARAEHWGLINEIVEPDALASRAHALATQIAANAPVAVQTAKQVLNAAGGVDLPGTLCALASAMTTGTEDAKAGTQAFLDRGKATYSGR